MTFMGRSWETALFIESLAMVGLNADAIFL